MPFIIFVESRTSLPMLIVICTSAQVLAVREAGQPHVVADRDRETDVFEEFDFLAEAFEGFVVLALDVICGSVCGVAVRGLVVHGERGRGPAAEEGSAVRIAVQQPALPVRGSERASVRPATPA